MFEKKQLFDESKEYKSLIPIDFMSRETNVDKAISMNYNIFKYLQSLVCIWTQGSECAL